MMSHKTKAKDLAHKDKDLSHKDKAKEKDLKRTGTQILVDEPAQSCSYNCHTISQLLDAKFNTFR